MSTENTAVGHWVRTRCADAEVIRWTGDLLASLCRIDTTLGDDLERLRHGETASYEVLKRALEPFLPDTTVWRRIEVPAELVRHPAWTAPAYANRAADDVAAVYAGRANLLIDPVPAAGGADVLLDVHVDTVPPHVPLTITPPGRYAGRGAVDDKGAIASAALALRLLHERRIDTPVRLLVSIDEEMGGNGSLAAVEQLDLTDTSVIVMEPTSSRPHPANRGAVWFSVSIRCDDDRVRADAFAEVVLALAATGRRLRESSRHPLFTRDDVSFCLGVVDDFGDHPASACTSVTLRWKGLAVCEEVKRLSADRFRVAVDRGDLDDRSPAPTVGVDSDGGIVVTTHAIGGHMGSDERDHDAIVKAAHVVVALRDGGLGLPDVGDAGEVRIEGGQGFLPDRPLEEVIDLLRRAVSGAIERVTSRQDVDDGALRAEITFERLRNDAYASRSDAGLADRLSLSAALVSGDPVQKPTGWRASCDARLFALRCDEVVTFGPGMLASAHRPEEYVELSDVVDAAAMLVLALDEGRS